MHGVASSGSLPNCRQNDARLGGLAIALAKQRMRVLAPIVGGAAKLLGEAFELVKILPVQLDFERTGQRTAEPLENVAVFRLLKVSQIVVDFQEVADTRQQFAGSMRD